MMRSTAWHVVGPMLGMCVFAILAYWIESLVPLMTYIGLTLFVKIDNCEYYLEQLRREKP